MPNNNEFIGPKKEEEEKKEEAKSGYLYDQSTNSFKTVGSASGSAGYVYNKQHTSVPRTANANEINSSNKGQAVIHTKDDSVVINKEALGANDKLYVGNGKIVSKTADKNQTLTLFDNKTYLSENLYSLEKEDKGRKEGYKKSLSADQLKEEQKKLREFNKEDSKKESYCNADGDCIEYEKGPDWRKQDGDDGLIYNIWDMLKNPGGISFEGYLLYEKPIDIDKYTKSVYSLGEEIATPVEKVKVNTEAFVANTTTDNENSAFDDQTRRERNKLNQVINNVEETGKIKDRLIKDLSSKIKEFDDFNKNLRYLKRGAKLKRLIEEKDQINRERTLLNEESNVETYSYPPKKKREPKTLDDTKKVEYEIIDLGRKLIQPPPQDPKSFEPSYTFERYQYRIKVIARTYLYISDEGITKNVAWENRDSFLGEIEKLEGRFIKAGREYRIPYKGLHIVDMDDKNSEWYYD